MIRITMVDKAAAIRTLAVGLLFGAFAATAWCAEPATGATATGSNVAATSAAPAVSSSKSLLPVTATDLKGAYAKNGELYVNTFGTPEGKPLTTGHHDMKPSWSKTSSALVFFRLIKAAKEVPDWITAICTIKTDGTGFRQLTDGTHTDFNPTWTRDGKNLILLNRQNKVTRGYVVMFTQSDARAGDEYAVSDSRVHTYGYSCLKDGRLFVSYKSGYALMTPGRDNSAKYEPIQCELAKTGRLDRVSVSPSETKVCFELQRGFGPYKYPGRILYIADFDAKARTVTNPKIIANEAGDKEITYLYPRWTRDESAVVYHCNKTGHNQLYMYRLKDGSTIRVSTDAGAEYLFPHGEATPK